MDKNQNNVFLIFFLNKVLTKILGVSNTFKIMYLTRLPSLFESPKKQPQSPKNTLWGGGGGLAVKSYAVIDPKEWGFNQS